MRAKAILGAILAGAGVLALRPGQAAGQAASYDTQADASGGTSWGYPPAVDVLARTIWGEARGEGAQGMEAVAAVIMNRVASARYPNTVEGVCKQRFQFSAWNEGDPNRARMLAVDETDRAFRQALGIAEAAIDGRLHDPTGGATHYHTAYVSPFWADASKVSAQIGSHVFYRGIA